MRCTVLIYGKEIVLQLMKANSVEQNMRTFKMNGQMSGDPVDEASSILKAGGEAELSNGPHARQITYGSGPSDEELEDIPTACIIDGIPFSVRKEQLVALMTEMSLPLPYALSYHFDNGVFGGMASANFMSQEETVQVIEAMNDLELGGRKLRVAHPKRLPLHERERIKREERARRDQMRDYKTDYYPLEPENRDGPLYDGSSSSQSPSSRLDTALSPSQSTPFSSPSRSGSKTPQDSRGRTTSQPYRGYGSRASSPPSRMTYTPPSPVEGPSKMSRPVSPASSYRRKSSFSSAPTYSTSSAFSLSQRAETYVPVTGSASIYNPPQQRDPAAGTSDSEDLVRVVQSRPKPQCWEHGCNGRQFSTYSNLMLHQRSQLNISKESDADSIPSPGGDVSSLLQPGVRDNTLLKWGTLVSEGKVTIRFKQILAGIATHLVSPWSLSRYFRCAAYHNSLEQNQECHPQKSVGISPYKMGDFYREHSSIEEPFSYKSELWKTA
jgi:hypothetical protein